MNPAIKGALYNALLFPGWGEIYLKSYKRGILIIIAVLAGMFSILWSIILTTIDILKVAPFKKGTVTFEAVMQLTIRSLRELDFSFIGYVLLFLILLWIISIADAYLLGKEQMLKSNTDVRQQSVSPEG